MSKKKDTFMAGPSPYHPRTPDVEAAKHLASVCRRFVEERANAGDVDAAILVWKAARAEAKKEPA